jgi:hypothetical protein
MKQLLSDFWDSAANWTMAAVMAGSAFAGVIVWLAKLPVVQKQQQQQLDRIEKKLDEMKLILAEHGLIK